MPDIGADLQSAYEEGFHAGYDQAMSEMPENKWIPISEKYPKPGELVLLSYPAYTAACGDEYVEGVGCGYLIETALNKYWARSDGIVIGELGFSPVDPVAWMPLPEPQKQ